MHSLESKNMCCFQVNFPTQNPLLNPKEDTEILSVGSVSNSDSGRGNSSEEGDNNVAVVAFIATDYVRSNPEKRMWYPRAWHYWGALFNAHFSF